MDVTRGRYPDGVARNKERLKKADRFQTLFACLKAAEMLRIARYAVAVNPNPDLEQLAREREWTIYWPAGSRK